MYVFINDEIKEDKKKVVYFNIIYSSNKKELTRFFEIIELKVFKKKNGNKKVTTMNKKLASDISLI